ncbi:hypothetical protein CCMA1212_007244 [Trichoderma ghanense]|uniref:Secreted protein n=1 Tax=Trichoderma ghanense TaxID=65468 RepID=A0ABY2GYE2_9HYPO
MSGWRQGGLGCSLRSLCLLAMHAHTCILLVHTLPYSIHTLQESGRLDCSQDQVPQLSSSAPKPSTNQMLQVAQQLEAVSCKPYRRFHSRDCPSSQVHASTAACDAVAAIRPRNVSHGDSPALETLHQ